MNKETKRKKLHKHRTSKRKQAGSLWKEESRPFSLFCFLQFAFAIVPTNMNVSLLTFSSSLHFPHSFHYPNAVSISFQQQQQHLWPQHTHTHTQTSFLRLFDTWTHNKSSTSHKKKRERKKKSPRACSRFCCQGNNNICVLNLLKISAF